MDPGDLLVQVVKPVNIVDVVVGRDETACLSSSVICFVISRGLEAACYVLYLISICIRCVLVLIRNIFGFFCIADFSNDASVGGYVSSTSQATLSFGDCCCIEGPDRAFLLRAGRFDGSNACFSICA